MRHRRSIAAVTLAWLAAGCAPNPLGPADPVPVLAGTYVFTCAAWSPEIPPAQRTIMDLSVWNGGAGTQPALEVVDVLKAQGARIRHVFNTPRVRVEMDVASVATLHVVDGQILIHRANTVSDPQDYHLRVVVSYDRPIGSDDVARLAALGAVVESSTANTLIATVDDGRVEEIRGLPGVVAADDPGGPSCSTQG
ncbi:MAG TPA: hypothetical protein VFO19_12070 [Vicinamibacterales bacterium]|nr:hypothetical protein [Vicinamibacterales bacterium]